MGESWACTLLCLISRIALLSSNLHTYGQIPQSHYMLEEGDLIKPPSHQLPTLCIAHHGRTVSHPVRGEDAPVYRLMTSDDPRQDVETYT